ncbi:hypothetical protein F414_gp21 [Cronobacter phage ESP2949-1]|uniref:Uncharacterized protein n=1 Tax=Cronobacter phage ESP2949-1 TaxID=2920894 RepID=G1CSR8_9CAUD|nr:hypothetical protein F414_gp21 [Cronobacter phage ESP2949-1]AEM24783.1 hypothetical protein [Cronobacter phage ESP2949-1]
MMPLIGWLRINKGTLSECLCGFLPISAIADAEHCVDNCRRAVINSIIYQGDVMLVIVGQCGKARLIDVVAAISASFENVSRSRQAHNMHLMAARHKRINFLRETPVAHDNHLTIKPGNVGDGAGNAPAKVVHTEGWLHYFFTQPDHVLAGRFTVQDRQRLFFALAVVVCSQKFNVILCAKHGLRDLEHWELKAQAVNPDASLFEQFADSVCQGIFAGARRRVKDDDFCHDVKTSLMFGPPF